MGNLFLNFRNSNWWYLFLLLLIIITTTFLKYIKKKSPSKYKETSNIIIKTMCVVFILSAIAMLAAFIFFGPSKDWIGNYMGVLLIVGPLIIVTLIIFALKQENKK